VLLFVFLLLSMGALYDLCNGFMGGKLLLLLLGLVQLVVAPPKVFWGDGKEENRSMPGLLPLQLPLKLCNAWECVLVVVTGE
jgi:hypothetical protein